MRILILSDIHANWEALHSIQEYWDQLFCLGDLVDYGPDPAACVRYIRRHATVTVKGNHDQAMGAGVDCRCSPPYRPLSEETRRATIPMLDASDREYLRSLPEQIEVEAGGARFLLTHATPRDPLYGYLPVEQTGEWVAQLEEVNADFVLVGHTHLSFVRSFGHRQLVNPGSVGQSKILGARAYYAIWEDGDIHLHSVPYAVERTIARLRAWTSVSPSVREDLAFVLKTGQLRPSSPIA